MEELNDTQSEPDDRGIDINWVGVNSFKFPIVFQDKSEEQSTIADFQLSVDPVSYTHLTLPTINWV